jgi:hypothetical protein
VTEVVVHPDRLELLSSGAWVSFRFEDMAQWPWPAGLWRLLAHVGWRPRWLPVGERAWSPQPSERCFQFYTFPELVVYLPDEDPETTHGLTLFQRVQSVMLIGGFSTWDLG